MLEVLRYIALNALNTVQKIKAMLKMSKIDKVHLRAVMLCMSKMLKIDQIHLRAVMLCMLKMSKIDQIHLRAEMLCMSKMGKEHTHTFWLITSLILNGFSIQKKFWKAETKGFSTMPSHPMYVEACWRCKRLSSTSLTCFNIHSVWWYGWKSPKAQLSKTFFGLKIH